jgi:hypothetical protein
MRKKIVTHPVFPCIPLPFDVCFLCVEYVIPATLQIDPWRETPCRALSMYNKRFWFWDGITLSSGKRSWTLLTKYEVNNKKPKQFSTEPHDGWLGRNEGENLTQKARISLKGNRCIAQPLAQRPFVFPCEFKIDAVEVLELRSFGMFRSRHRHGTIIYESNGTLRVCEVRGDRNNDHLLLFHQHQICKPFWTLYQSNLHGSKMRWLVLAHQTTVTLFRICNHEDGYTATECDSTNLPTDIIAVQGATDELVIATREKIYKVVLF